MLPMQQYTIYTKSTLAEIHNYIAFTDDRQHIPRNCNYDDADRHHRDSRHEQERAFKERSHATKMLVRLPTSSR
jgi:hypothetical protein